MMNRVLKSMKMRKQIYKQTIIGNFDFFNVVKTEKIIIFMAHSLPRRTEQVHIRFIYDCMSTMLFKGSGLDQSVLDIEWILSCVW